MKVWSWICNKIWEKENVILPFVAGSLHKTELGMPEIKGDAGPLDKSFEQMYQVFRGLQASRLQSTGLMTLICHWLILIVLFFSWYHVVLLRRNINNQPPCCFVVSEKDYENLDDFLKNIKKEDTFGMIYGRQREVDIFVFEKKQI